ncbi:MATE family efflux transporter [Pseudomonas sp. HK3]
MSSNSSLESQKNPILSGSIVSNFFALFIPSIIGLLAFSSASLIDGIYIGNFVGATALAAINLLIPFLTIVFGIGYMLAVGGSVRGGKYIGQGHFNRASSVFSKILIICISMSLITVSLGLYFEEGLFRALGATPELMPLMSEYFRIRFPFMIAEMFIIVMYYFVRIDGYANFSAIGILMSSIINIILDYFFVVELEWGLAGAAWATGFAQISAFVFFTTYFMSKKRKLYFRFKQQNWLEVMHASFNGLSEFINEVSGSIIAFILNWLLITTAGTNGVAAITIINYLLFIGIMVVYSISEACQVFVSQNFGAGNIERIKQYTIITAIACAITSFVFILLLLGFTEQMVSMFLNDDSEDAAKLAIDYVDILWPIFLVNGFTICISAYLTALHAAKESATIALSRGLILPSLLIFILYYYAPSIPFLWALPIAEGLTFLLAMVLFLRNQPHKHIDSVKHD